ncbi:MAG: tRNA lysidine(34) synthetase TilS [Buchnera aphidicola (Periphyllus aceris)]|nr:tRNA lysidine(34) synthetase TilS [Buchnera aphidicola (Periphyllus aceris)]
MLNFKKKILKYKKFLVAFSGGIDSTVLLYKLLEIQKKKKIKIRAIHINHQISSKSNFWNKHCKKICFKKNISFIEEKIFLKNSNVECQARKKRYKLFKKHLLNNEVLLTGHNLNDQCETLILAIKRGSGPQGLSGISYKKKFYKNILIRPLLKFSRQEIKKWACKKKIKWITDKSNYNISYDRNFIRHKIIPILTNRWKYFQKNCFRTTQLIQHENIVLNNFIKPIIKKNLFKKKSLNLKKIKKLDLKTQHIIVRKWMNINKISSPSLILLKNIFKSVIYNKKKKNPKIVFKKYNIWNYKNYLFCIKNTPNIKNNIIFWYPPYKKLILPNNLGSLKIKNKKYAKKEIRIKKPKKNQLVTIKFQTNKKFQTKNNKKKLKKIFNELKIPPWKRKKIPLLFYNDKFISIIGKCVTQQKYNTKKKKISIIWNTKN